MSCGESETDDCYFLRPNRLLSSPVVCLGHTLVSVNHGSCALQCLCPPKTTQRCGWIDFKFSKFTWCYSYMCVLGFSDTPTCIIIILFDNKFLYKKYSQNKTCNNNT